MTSGACSFWIKGRKPPKCSGAACLPGTACCPRGLLSSLHGEKGGSVILAQICVLRGQWGSAGACVWCDVPQCYGTVPAALLGPAPRATPQETSLLLQMVFLVRGVWFIVFNLSWSVKKKRNLAVDLTPSHSCLSMPPQPPLSWLKMKLAAWG